LHQFPMERGQKRDGPQDRKEMAALREPESRARLASVLELHEADTQKVGQSQRPLTARVLRVLPEATVPLTFPPRRPHSAHPNIWQRDDGAKRKPPKFNLTIPPTPIPPHKSCSISVRPFSAAARYCHRIGRERVSKPPPFNPPPWTGGWVNFR
jgi:hypothetical protein